VGSITSRRYQARHQPSLRRSRRLHRRPRRSPDRANHPASRRQRAIPLRPACKQRGQRAPVHCQPQPRSGRRRECQVQSTGRDCTQERPATAAGQAPNDPSGRTSGGPVVAATPDPNDGSERGSNLGSPPSVPHRTRRTERRGQPRYRRPRTWRRHRGPPGARPRRLRHDLCSTFRPSAIHRRKRPISPPVEPPHSSRRRATVCEPGTVQQAGTGQSSTDHFGPTASATTAVSGVALVPVDPALFPCRRRLRAQDSKRRGPSGFERSRMLSGSPRTKGAAAKPLGIDTPSDVKRLFGRVGGKVRGRRTA
jgi:hypothetical protein